MLNMPKMSRPFRHRIQWAQSAAYHTSVQVCLYLTSFRILWRTCLKGNQKWGQVAQPRRQRGISMTTKEEARGVRINGITMTPRALSLSRITLFFTVSTAQTITNSTNEALQYRESRNRSRRQLSAALRCSRQSSRNDYAMLFNAQLALRKLLL